MTGEYNPESIRCCLSKAKEGFAPFLSIDNERAAWKYIVEVVDELLDKFPTTCQEDLDILM